MGTDAVRSTYGYQVDADTSVHSSAQADQNYRTAWRAIVLLLATTLQLCAAEVPPHIARGHLLAAFCGASPDKKPEHVTAIYREIIPVAAPPGSYTTVARKSDGRASFEPGQEMPTTIRR